jgi:hypothetical protein
MYAHQLTIHSITLHNLGYFFTLAIPKDDHLPAPHCRTQSYGATYSLILEMYAVVLQRRGSKWRREHVGNKKLLQKRRPQGETWKANTYASTASTRSF